MATLDQETAPMLKRTLSLWQVSLSGVGVILGAGVYALVGPAAGEAGNALWLAFFIAGSAAGLTTYSYAALGRMRPKDSPEFQYTALAFGPGAGFIAGWLMLAADILAAVTVALGFGGYLTHLLGTPLVLNALGLLVLVAVVVYAGIGESIGLAIVLTVIEAAGLLFVIVIGLPSWGRTDYLEMPQGISGVWSAASLIFFAYLGFDELGNLAEEMRHPERDLPRALFLSMTASTVIYLLVAVSTVSVVSWQELSASEAPLAVVAGTVLGNRADTVLSLIALAATANTVLLLIISGSRSVYGMASAGVLPAGLARVTVSQLPVRATTVVLGLTGALVLLGDLARVAALTNATVLLSFMMVNLSLPWLALDGRIRHRRQYLRALVIPPLAFLLCGWLLVSAGWVSVAAAFGLVVVGWAVRLVGRRGAKR